MKTWKQKEIEIESNINKLKLEKHNLTKNEAKLTMVKHRFINYFYIKVNIY
jgi:hypothetical protein